MGLNKYKQKYEYQRQNELVRYPSKLRALDKNNKTVQLHMHNYTNPKMSEWWFMLQY